MAVCIETTVRRDGIVHSQQRSGFGRRDRFTPDREKDFTPVRRLGFSAVGRVVNDAGDRKPENTHVFGWIGKEINDANLSRTYSREYVDATGGKNFEYVTEQIVFKPWYVTWKRWERRQQQVRRRG